MLPGCLVAASPGTASLSLLAFFTGPCVCSLRSADLSPGGGPRGLRSCSRPCCIAGSAVGGLDAFLQLSSRHLARLFPDQGMLVTFLLLLIHLLIFGTAESCCMSSLLLRSMALGHFSSWLQERPRVSSVVAVPGSRAQAEQLWCAGFVVPRTWNLPRPGIEPVTPALADGFLTTEPPGRP